ncbi:hypothetical protein CPC16_008999 [Podila verticillata]|nr:hypothetical protein CPC16_008999 [Podila verticillata]
MDHPSVSQSYGSLTASTTNANTGGSPSVSSNNNNNNNNNDSSLLHTSTNAQGDLIGSPYIRRKSNATFESASTMVSTASLGEKAKGSDGKMGKGLESDEGSLTIPQRSMRGDREGGVSSFKTCAALVCVVGGTGTLGMPHALAQSGWVGAMIILLALFMSTYTGIILIECLYLKTDTRRTSYQDIATAAFGNLGHYFALVVVAVNLFGCAVLYTILSATLMEDMIESYGHMHVPTYLLVMACSVFVWACLISTKTMKEVAWLSILGAGATIGVVCITVGVSSSELINRVIETTSSTHTLVDWSKIPLSLATISFAYGGNVIYPHMEASMARPRSWPRALWAALSFCFVMYMLIAVVGYLTFGAETESPVLKNLPRGAWSSIANSLIIIHVLLAAPILLTSLSMMAEASITQRFSQFEQGSPRKRFLKRGLLRTGIIVLVGFVAAVVPFFGDMMDLLGSLTACLLVFIMPVMFYYRLGGLQKAGWATKAWTVLILLVGAVALVLGTLDAVRHLVIDFKRK